MDRSEKVQSEELEQALADGQALSGRRAGALDALVALAGVTLVVMLLGGGLGVAYAAGDALPGDPLYAAKRGLELLQLALTSSPGHRANLRARFAGERLQEAETLLAAGREAEVDSLLSEYQSELAAMIDLAQQATDVEHVQGLQRALAAQEQALARFLERSNGTGEQAVGAAIEEARHSQAVLESLLEGGSPSDLAPGQQGRGTETPDDGNGQGHGQGQGGGRWRRTPTPTAP